MEKYRRLYNLNLKNLFLSDELIKVYYSNLLISKVILVTNENINIKLWGLVKQKLWGLVQQKTLGTSATKNFGD